MPIIITREGNELLEFVQSQELEMPQDAPLTFVLNAIRCQDKYLFIYNRHRHQWEIPGGGIEPGETPHEAACRELMEESCQRVSQLRFVGLFKIRLRPDDRLEYGALFAGELEQLDLFTANDEASSLTLWNLHSRMEGHVSELSYKLVELALYP